MCGCVCPSASAWSVGSQHVSDTRGREWKREKRGGTERRWVWSGKQRRMGSDVGASRGRAVNPGAIRRRELTRS